jgi:hypothetical protein
MLAGQETATLQTILTACHVSDTQANPKQINEQVACIERATRALTRQLAAENALQAAIGQLDNLLQNGYPAPVQPDAGASSGSSSSGSSAGASTLGTPTTCGPGASTNDPLIRVHRALMAPKNAADDFGYRLGRKYVIYQVTISNDNRDFQYLIHDVSVDLSALFGAKPGTYEYAASSQDLSLLRGVPEKGQDLDRRNWILHLLQGIGSVAGAVSGLTPFSSIFGSSVAVFSGSFLQAYAGIAPDHTATQLNRLSDSAYITNTLVDRQHAKTIAIFVPSATILTNRDQAQYWRNPGAFLERMHLEQADVCVDGAFITTVTQTNSTRAQ